MSAVLPGPVGASLAGLVPSLLAELGVPGFGPAPPDRLLPGGTSAVCLLLVDGLGWQLLGEHAADAPFLAGLAAGARPVTAGFPSTTAASITSLGTGVPAGTHGIVGYSFAVGGRLLQPLSWTVREDGRGVDAREELPPEDVQPLPTALERAAAAGVRVQLAVPGAFRGSGLTRAALRGGSIASVHALGDLAATALAGLTKPAGPGGPAGPAGPSGPAGPGGSAGPAEPAGPGGSAGPAEPAGPGGSAGPGGEGPALSYAYHGDLDLLGHVYGPGSLPWRLQLSHVDRLAAAIAGGLPAGGALVVTADHGMVHVPPDHRLDVDTTPALRDGLRLLGGEPRARYLYTEPGATAAVRATWTALLGDRAWIADRDEAIAAGWYGPAVADHVRDRIGDLIVAARTDIAITRSATEPTLTRLLGHHGSLTPQEQLVPVLVAG